MSELELPEARETKIIATLGPSSADFESIERLYLAGANFFRLNFSHGSHADHQNYAEIIHQIRLKYDADIGILADLQGPKIRINQFINSSIDLHTDMRIRMDADMTHGGLAPEGQANALGYDARVCLPHPDVMEGLQEGYRILLDDGNVALRIEEKGDDYVIGSVLSGRKLSNNKGVNVPQLNRDIAALTEKDARDLEAALALGVDWVALSFVQTAQQVADVKSIIGDRAKLMAKIEKPKALHNILGIIEKADGIMVARGDLGVEIKYTEVPIAQNVIVALSRIKEKPAVVATQMLESIIQNPRATRAEINDLHWAIRQKASATMLSGETAAGLFPVEAVRTMDETARRVEFHMNNREASLQDIFGDASDEITALLSSAPMEESALLTNSREYPRVALCTWQGRRAGGHPVLMHLGAGAPGANGRADVLEAHAR